jgi:hypothetical protein
LEKIQQLQGMLEKVNSQVGVEGGNVGQLKEQVKRLEGELVERNRLKMQVTEL